MFRLARLLLGAFFIALMSVPAGAVATTSVACVTAWTDLGAGPMIVQTSSPACVIAIADLTPGVSLVGFHFLGSAPFSYTGSSHLWARGAGAAVIAK